jgi:hypothetical protein
VRQKRNAYRVLVGKGDRKRPFGKLGMDGRIILKWILNRLGACGLDSSDSG